MHASCSIQSLGKTFITDRTAPIKLCLTQQQNTPLETQTKISKWTNYCENL